MTQPPPHPLRGRGCPVITGPRLRGGRPSSGAGAYEDVAGMQELGTPLPRDRDAMAAPWTPGEPDGPSPARQQLPRP